jgi:hypothetical protein
MDPQDTYAESKPVVRDGPSPVDALLEDGGTLDDVLTSLHRIQRAAQAAPDDPRVVDAVRRLMLNVLERDAFIDYLAEDERRYVVSARAADVLTVPKLREAQDPFPPKKSTKGQRLLRLCLWMLAGLLPAGMLTLALWPIVSRRALRLAHSHPDSSIEARRAILALRLALALGVVAVVLAGLLFLHWLG